MGILSIFRKITEGIKESISKDETAKKGPATLIDDSENLSATPTTSDDLDDFSDDNKDPEPLESEDTFDKPPAPGLDLVEDLPDETPEPPEPLSEEETEPTPLISSPTPLPAPAPPLNSIPGVSSDLAEQLNDIEKRVESLASQESYQNSELSRYLQQMTDLNERLDHIQEQQLELERLIKSKK